MTEYCPRLDTGLQSDDAVLSERIERHATPTEAHRPGVYAVVLSVPDNVREQFEAEYDVVPEYLDMVEQKQRTVYVGASGDVYSRLVDHVEGEVRQTALTRICPPHTIHDIWFFDEADRAFERESGIAMKLQHDIPEWYVHCR